MTNIKISALYTMMLPLLWSQFTTASSPEDDVIIVTANKRLEALNTVDGSVLIKTGEELEQAGVTQVQDLEKVFPGLQIRSRGNRTYPATTIRGISSPDFYSPSVQIYVDGVPQDHQFMTQELINVERVEFLRGPQGTLYGGNAQAGVINVITRDPQNSPTMYLAGDYATLKRDITASGTVPLIEDKLYATLSGRWMNEPGQIDNPLTGKKNLDSSDTWTGRAKVAYQPIDSPLSADFSFSHENLRSHEEVYLTDQQLKQKKYDGETPLLKREVNSYTFKAAYDFDGTTLTSVTSYQDRDVHRKYVGGQWQEKREGVNQELRLNTEYKNGASSLFGTYFAHDKAHHNSDAYPGYYGAAENKITQTSYALFGEGKLPILKDVDLTIGSRLSYENSEIDYSGRTGYAAIDAFDNSSNNTIFTPKVALGWQYTPETRLYISATRGYKPGGFNRIISSMGDKKAYDPETSDNYELGWHTSFFNKKMTLDGAFYYIRSKDKQVYVGAVPIQVIQNLGKAESKGLELTVKATPVENLSLSLGGSFGKSSYSNATDPISGVVYNNKRLPYAPDIMVNAGMEYLLEQSVLPGNLYLSTTARYYSKSYFDEQNSLEQGAYTLYDAAISLEMPNGVTVKVFGDNLTNEKYRTSSFYLGSTPISMINKGINVGAGVSISL